MDPSREQRPIPPPWHQVVHGTNARSPQESVHHKQLGKFTLGPYGLSQSLGLKVTLPSLHSLPLTLLSSCVEYYNTNYHEINHRHACNKKTCVCSSQVEHY